MHVTTYIKNITLLNVITTPNVCQINVVKKYCMFNDETPIVHYHDIYSNPMFLGNNLYINCGKPPSNTFEKIMIDNSKTMVLQIPRVWECLSKF